MAVEPVRNRRPLFRRRHPAVPAPDLSIQAVLHSLSLESLQDALRLLDRHAFVRVPMDQQRRRVVRADVVVGRDIPTATSSERVVENHAVRSRLLVHAHVPRAAERGAICRVDQGVVVGEVPPPQRYAPVVALGPVADAGIDQAPARQKVIRVDKSFRLLEPELAISSAPTTEIEMGTSSTDSLRRVAVTRISSSTAASGWAASSARAVAAVKRNRGLERHRRPRRENSVA